MRFGYAYKNSRFLDIKNSRFLDNISSWSDFGQKFGQAGKILDRNLGDFGQNFGQVDQIWAIWTTL